MWIGIAIGVTASTAHIAPPPDPPVITTTSLPDGEVDSAYSQTLSATGGTSPYTWAVTTGSLPTGLSLNASTGAIAGTPSADGTATFTVTVTDAVSQTDTQGLSIVVAAAPAELVTDGLVAGWQFAGLPSDTQTVPATWGSTTLRAGSSTGNTTHDPTFATEGAVFDAAEGDYLINDATAGMSFTTGMTLNFVLQLPSRAQSNCYLLELYSNVYAVIYGYVANSFELFTSSGPDYRTGSQITVPDTGWHMLTYAFGDGHLRGYLDAVEIFDRSLSGTVSGGGSTTFILGSAASGAASLSTTIAAAPMYNRALTAGEVAQNYDYFKSELASAGVTLP